MIIPVKTRNGGYNIYFERGALGRVGELLKLDRKVLVVTDNGVPAQYAETVVSQAKEGYIVTIEQGEKSKGIKTFELLLSKLVEYGFTRTDCVVAVGGGVVGDLSGFAASCFMRGIDFYNIPTTVLSQVDSSIGGKTAIDFMQYKNIVGAFWPPAAVIIDPETLSTLPPRQISNGLAESVKMALTFDSDLFELLEREDISAHIDEVIYRSILLKKAVVEEDETEKGLRKVLNFGHTIAHAIESEKAMEDYFHGECVAVGMIPMCSDRVKARLVSVLNKLSLPTSVPCDLNVITEAVRHDKKASGENITFIWVEEAGTFEMKKCSFDEFDNLVKEKLA
ncbi:MAG: 3-dehydroquinate synthase [Clostridia bacterium]|nr:3-dehydroquinate synthase [Clostridia bacterium]